MKVSIIVTVYNLEKYIKRCLDSLVEQTYYNIDIIIVDDGSSDKSSEIIELYRKSNKNIKYIYQRNKGVQSARKNGLKYADGDYILIIDGDDYLERTCIEELIKAAQNDYDIVYYNYKYIFSGKDHVNKTFYMNFEYEDANKNEFLFNYFTKDMQNGLCLKFIKREYIERNSIDFIIEGYSYGEDLLGTIILGVYNPKVFYLDKCLYNYVQRSSSIVNEGKLESIAEVLLIFEYIDENLKDTIVFNKYREEYEYFKYKETYLGYCINGSNSGARRIFYDYWVNSGINIFDNKIYKKIYYSYSNTVKEKIYYYNLSFELGENMRKYVFDNSESNKERMKLINNYITNDKTKRLEIYNDLYEKLFSLQDISVDLVDRYNPRDIIIYGYSNVAIYLKKYITRESKVHNIYMGDGYINKDGIISLEKNIEIFKKSDLIIITAIHAFDRISKYIEDFGIEKEKIISLNRLLEENPF